MSMDAAPLHAPDWFRVAPLRLGLRTGVTVSRQPVRGAVWHVLTDPVSGRHHRFNASAYRFIVACDGRRSLDEVWEKDGAAGLKAQHAFVNLLTSPASDSLLETWEIRATAVDGEKPRYLIDFTTTQRCAGKEALKLPLYRYGGLGFRGHRTWDGAGNCEFLTSEGITDRVKGNESKARWLWAGGTVDGATAGVTILSHPENFRAPQPLRIHPTEPFVCFAPQQAGDMEIKPGETYVSRYRFVIADGKPAAADADAWWKEYTEKKEGK